MLNKDCPIEDDWRIFLSGEISANKKVTLELHLAGCTDCRRNLALMFGETTENFAAPDSLKEKVKNLPVKAESASFNPFSWLKIYRLQVGFATMLIVCFGLVGIYFLQNQKPSNSDDVLRNSAAKNDSFKLLAPEDNVIIEGSFVDFEWEKVPAAISYTLIISNEKGDIIFQEQTKQTKFKFGRAYPSKRANQQDKGFWYVQAKLIDGRITESTPRKITFER